MKALVDGLMELGWIEKRSFPQPLDEQETQTFWSWLATEVQSDYLLFVPDAYWSAGWDEDARERNKQLILDRLNHKKDIDLMLAFGTKAGLDMANNLHSVPTMALSCSDPIRSGIIKSAGDSGYDHLHAKVDPKRYERQLRLFHEIVKFKKLGIAYEDTPTGRSYAAIEDARRVAAELGFEILECQTLDEDKNVRECEDSVVECCRRLAPHVDAFYITLQNGVTPRNLSRMLEPLFKYKVITFSQRSTKDVKYGVTLSLAPENYKELGRFYARTMVRILNGAKPRELPQVFENTQQIAINVEAAKRTRFQIPLDVLAGAQEIYEHIENVDDANY
jgi:ABC-type uncharacterized transport system substrate-binding protein